MSSSLNSTWINMVFRKRIYFQKNLNHIPSHREMKLAYKMGTVFYEGAHWWAALRHGLNQQGGSVQFKDICQGQLRSLKKISFIIQLKRWKRNSIKDNLQRKSWGGDIYSCLMWKSTFDETFVLVQCSEPLKLLGSGVHSFEMDALSAIQHVLCVFLKLTCANRLPIITLTCHQLPVIDIIVTCHWSLGVLFLIS